MLRHATCFTIQCRRLWFNSWVGKSHWRRNRLPVSAFWGFPGGSDGLKKKICLQWRSLGLIPGLERSPGDGQGYPLQYSAQNAVLSLLCNPSKTRMKKSFKWITPWGRGKREKLFFFLRKIFQNIVNWKANALKMHYKCGSLKQEKLRNKVIYSAEYSKASCKLMELGLTGAGAVTSLK